MKRDYKTPGFGKNIHVRVESEVEAFLNGHPQGKSAAIREALRRMMNATGPTGTAKTENATN